MILHETQGREYIEAVELITIQIAEVIKSSDHTSESDDMFISDAIAELYDQRQDYLEKFASWYHSADGQDEIIQNSEYWNSRIQNLVKADTILVENIHRKMNESQIRLRTFQKQKSLLIYTHR
jgi:hypothetical protein